MRASEQEQTGGAGVSEVTGKFQRIGWGPVPNHAHDLGTDLLVQARDQRRFERGLIVGAQVKGGDSWFGDVERDSDGQVLGFWFYEPGTEHFDDWVTHGLPHLLVLHDLRDDVSYWVHVTADRVIGTGKGCKILVPVDQKIDDNHVEQLLDVAYQQRAAPRLEGSSFTASAQQVPPGRRVRFALLAPRLIAPHRNVGHSREITSGEALALCAQGRFRDLLMFAEAHASVTDPRELYAGRDWRWMFVRAFWQWATSDQVDDLRVALDRAPDGQCKAAAGAVLACALLRKEAITEALSLLDNLVAKDDLDAVGHAWILVQRARIRAEVGDVPGARADAVEAQRQFPGDADDVTVSALAAAAAWLLFTTSGREAGELGTALTAADTAINWWRSQTISSALGKASQRAFQAWSQDQTTRWEAEDGVALNLFAAELSADLTGEQASWRGVAALSARLSLIKAHAQDDVTAVAEALDGLRRSGDKPSLKLAITHIRRVGPAAALSMATSSLDPTTWTHSNAHTNLELVALAGEMIDVDAADKWTGVLTDIFLDPTPLAGQVRPTFLVGLAVAEALAGILPATTTAGRIRVAELLAGLELPIQDVLAPTIARWVDEFEYEQFETNLIDGLRLLAENDSERVGARLLGWLAEHGDATSGRLVHDRALAGDSAALSAMGDITALAGEDARTLIHEYDGMVARTIERAASSEWAFGTFDAASALTLFNIWFPDQARWGSLLNLLSHAAVATEQKRGALQLLVDFHDRVPEDIRDRVGQNLDAIAAAPILRELGGQPLGGLVTAVGIVTGVLVDEQANVAVAQLALGSDPDKQAAARLLGGGWCAKMRPLLPSFVADSSAPVRVTAARAVGRLASSDPDPVVIALARRLTEDSGVIVPPALLVGLTQGPTATELARETASALLGHASARVSRLARQSLAHLQAES